MSNENALDALCDIRVHTHPNCVVCSRSNAFGLRLAFTLLDGGIVQARFVCESAHEGFPGMLHGGVITSLLDGAMTNCLFAQGRIGVTGELTVRFRHPVATGRMALLRAWSDGSAPPFHVLKAELIQDQQVKARATGKFVEQAESQLKYEQERQASP